MDCGCPSDPISTGCVSPAAIHSRVINPERSVPVDHLPAMNSVMRTSDAVDAVGRSAMRHRIAVGKWQRPCRGVVVAHNGPLSADERHAVALAASAPGAALAGPTALEIDGFQGFSATEIHVVLPEGAAMPSLPGLVVHVSTELSDLDVHPARTPRRTRPARSVLDFASWQTHQRRARAIVIASVQQGVVTSRLLREALVRRGPCRHRALIRESILDVDGGTQSLPERDFSDIWSAMGLPRMSRQQPVKRADGSYFLDVFCESLGFGVEIHGAPHLAVERWDSDLARANEIAVRGTALLFFSSHAVRRAKPAVAHQLIDMARAHGWRGETNLDGLRLLEQPKPIRFPLSGRRS